MLHLLLLTALATQAVLCEDTPEPEPEPESEPEPEPEPGPELPDKPSQVSQRIIGGNEAKPHSWPWQVSLQEQLSSGFEHVCDGILIEKEWVMTAAHCVADNIARRVLIGGHNIDSLKGKEQYITVSSAYTHPNWKRDVKMNDIALLRLASKAKLNKNVKLASLPKSNQILPSRSHCYATGWGNAKSGQSSPVLMEVKMPVVDSKTCFSSWGNKVVPDVVCAGGVTSSCFYGDSGGPLSCEVKKKYFVFGVTSFGGMDCTSNMKPTVFTQVSAYIDWINEITKKNKWKFWKKF